MKPGKVKDTILELQKYNLGSRYPSSEVQKMLREDMRVPLVAHWDSDDKQWEIYRDKDTFLIWQLSLPKTVNILSLDIKNYLKQFDSSKLGTRDDEERQKDFKYWFDHIRASKDADKKDKQMKEKRYEMRPIIRHLYHKFEGTKQCVVPAGPVIGFIKKQGRMVEVRATKKVRMEIP